MGSGSDEALRAGMLRKMGIRWVCSKEFSTNLLY